MFLRCGVAPRRMPLSLMDSNQRTQFRFPCQLCDHETRIFRESWPALTQSSKLIAPSLLKPVPQLLRQCCRSFSPLQNSSLICCVLFPATSKDSSSVKGCGASYQTSLVGLWAWGSVVCLCVCVSLLSCMVDKIVYGWIMYIFIAHPPSWLCIHWFFKALLHLEKDVTFLQ